jgi:hypothetical protein
MKHLLSILFCLLGGYVTAQPESYHPYLEQYDITKERDQVVISWTISKGNNCQGIQVLRSTDNENFEVIGNIEGICGSLESPVSYIFIDQNPVHNTKNYYKLQLGFNGTTEPSKSVLYHDLSSGILAYPNPVDLSTQDITILFYNPGGTDHILEMYDSQGNKLAQLNTTDDYFTISRSIVPLVSGTILLVLRDFSTNTVRVSRLVSVE